MEIADINKAAYSLMHVPFEQRENLIKETWTDANIIEIELIKRLADEYKIRGHRRYDYK